jgi:hypothetical protein
MILLSVVLCVLLLLILKIMSTLDFRHRVHKTNEMVKTCTIKNVNALQIVLVGSNPELLSETLFSITNEAECPRNLRITLFEHVIDFEHESSSVQAYKKKCSARGMYLSDFSELITVHQVLQTQCMVDAVRSLSAKDRPLTILVTEQSRFLPKWDHTLLQDFQGLPKDSIMYCGALHSSTSGSSETSFSSAFTLVESFTKKRMPVIRHRPLQRTGSCVRILWAAWPMLFETRYLNELSGCTLDDAAMQMVGRTIWSSRNPVAFTDSHSPDYTGLVSGFPVDKQSLLGILDVNDFHEVNMKFGSIGALRWALSM